MEMPLRGRLLNVLASACALVVLTSLPQLAMTAEVPRMTQEELKARLGSPDVIILDVRAGFDWDDAEWKIPGAIREDPKKEVRSWADRYPKEKTLVLYCA